MVSPLREMMLGAIGTTVIPVNDLPMDGCASRMRWAV